MNEHRCRYCGRTFERGVGRGSRHGSWMGETLADHYMVCPERRLLKEVERREELARRRA